MRCSLRWLAVLSAVLLLAACAHVPEPVGFASHPADSEQNAAQSWQLAGRFAAGQTSATGEVLRNPVAGRFVWQHQAATDVLWLIGPLGNTLAKIDIGPERVRWQDARGQRGEVSTLRELGEHFAGIALPDLPAQAWLRGLWSARQAAQFDAAGHALNATADGWQFAYRYGPPAPVDWPLAIDGNGPGGLWLRLVLTEWNGLSESAGSAAP